MATRNADALVQSDGSDGAVLMLLRTGPKLRGTLEDLVIELSPKICSFSTAGEKDELSLHVEQDMTVEDIDLDAEQEFGLRCGECLAVDLDASRDEGSKRARKLMEARSQQCVICLTEKEHTFVPWHEPTSAETVVSQGSGSQQHVVNHRFCTECWAEFFQHHLNRGKRSEAPSAIGDEVMATEPIKYQHRRGLTTVPINSFGTIVTLLPMLRVDWHGFKEKGMSSAPVSPEQVQVFKIGERIECRNRGEDWCAGNITRLRPCVLIRQDGLDSSCAFDEIRKTEACPMRCPVCREAISAPDVWKVRFGLSSDSAAQVSQLDQVVAETAAVSASAFWAVSHSSTTPLEVIPNQGVHAADEWKLESAGRSDGAYTCGSLAAAFAWNLNRCCKPLWQAASRLRSQPSA
jgi:hypothetical protein